MPNDNVLTDERVAAAKNIVAAWVQSRKTFIDGEAYGAAVELVAFALARNPGQPEPRAEVTALIAAAEQVVSADRACALDDSDINALADAVDAARVGDQHADQA
ncbi:hypothetical protein LGM39_26375 [Burkholderia cepacia]|uniref:hypothetical protein n=1 Tax=Burkholderia cepacia TaxID=292 RepID=UPI001CF17135|nr:hypothetical protein [Burkholderia cepacia]MCA7902902.1 hypothetical protein [Burkholderia cepacia]